MGSGAIKTRLRPDWDWQHTTFRLDGDAIYWKHAEKERPWQQIHQNEMPEWFSGFAAKALSRMDERAAKAQSGPRD
jgi:hypothetical protein